MADFQFRSVQAQSADRMFGDATEDERIAFMRSLGATNLDPPLVRSTHLRVRKTGMVLPWNDLLAEQTTLVENCDEHGNTDPSAWMSGVIEDPEYSPEERDAWAKEVVLSQASSFTGGYRGLDAPDVRPLEVTLPDGAVYFDDSGTPSSQEMPEEVTAAIDKMMSDL